MNKEFYKIVVKVREIENMQACLKILKQHCPEKGFAEIKRKISQRQPVWDYEELFLWLKNCALLELI